MGEQRDPTQGAFSFLTDQTVQVDEYHNLKPDGTYTPTNDPAGRSNSLGELPDFEQATHRIDLESSGLEFDDQGHLVQSEE